jgi:hypothetical protein
MDKHEKQAYLEAIRKRYRRAKRADKGKLWCNDPDLRYPFILRQFAFLFSVGKKCKSALHQNKRIPKVRIVAS